EARPVEALPAVAAERVERAPVQAWPGDREMGARRKHARSLPANPAPVNAARHARVSWETRASLNTPNEAQVHEIPSWRRMAVWPLAALVRLWAMSIRVRIPPEDQRALDAFTGPVVFALWHNRLFMAADMHRRIRPGR